MSFRENVRRGRSHLLTATVLIVGGSIVVGIEDRNLSREIGKPVPKRALGVPGTPVRPAKPPQPTPQPVSSERAEP